jgi:hypothetical protein
VLRQFSELVLISATVDVNAAVPDQVVAATARRLLAALEELDLLTLLPDAQEAAVV